MATSPILSEINYTILFSVMSISLAAMGTLIKIFSKKTPEEQLPGHSTYCKLQEKDIKAIMDREESEDKKNTDLKNIVGKMQTEVAILSTEAKNTSKNIEDIKENIKGVSIKMDDLLKQIMAWIE
jgi:glucan-binding YG repeat protein